MAKTYVGGTQVKRGYYVNRRSFGFVAIERDGGSLPGGADASWRRVPALAVMVGAPVLGGLFVVALPFIGFGVAAYTIAKKLGGGAKAGAREVVATIATPPVVPGTAHLTGQSAKGDGAAPAGDAAVDEKTEKLAEEIEAQRGKLY